MFAHQVSLYVNKMAKIIKKIMWNVLLNKQKIRQIKETVLEEHQKT